MGAARIYIPLLGKELNIIFVKGVYAPQVSESLLTLVQDFEWETLGRVKARGL